MRRCYCTIFITLCCHCPMPIYHCSSNWHFVFADKRRHCHCQTNGQNLIMLLWLPLGL